jgi:hypothetical protein
MEVNAPIVKYTYFRVLLLRPKRVITLPLIEAALFRQRNSAITWVRELERRQTNWSKKSDDDDGSKGVQQSTYSC